MSGTKKESLKEYHLQFAKSTDNRVWDLLENNSRSPAEDQELLLTAFASLYHWMNAGTAVNTQRGYWLLSRVHQALNKSKAALEWALKCQKVTSDHPALMEDFDKAFSAECLARAYALAGDHDQAKIHYEQAIALGVKIKDPDDKKIFMNDFMSGDWYQFSP